MKLNEVIKKDEILKMTKCITAIGGFALAAAIITSSVGIGFASWRTELTANGTVNANINWDVKVTDAYIELSEGASAVTETTVFERTNEKSDALIASTISSSTWVSDASLMGTQSNDSLSNYTDYYAIDTSKYSIDTLKSYTTASQMAAVKNDSTTLSIAGNLKAYYRYVTGLNDGSSEAANTSAKAVVNGLVKDAEALIKDKFPDTYKNYTIVYISGLYSGSAKTYSKYCHTIAAFKTTKTESTGKNAEFTDTEVTYNPITLGVTGAWASYNLTVTNNGTVSANLKNSEIKLVGDESMFTLEVPDLSAVNIEAGESASITFIVKLKDSDDASIKASTNLSVKLVLEQSEIEEAPSAAFEIK